MLELLITSLLTFGVSSNIVVNSGSGALLFAREKRYRFFRYLNMLFLVLGIGVCSIANYFLNKFVYVNLDIADISFVVVVLIAGLYNLAVSALWKKISSYGHYLYENSYSYATDLIFTVFSVMTLDYSLEIVPFVMTLAAVIIVVIVMTVIVGFYVESINRSYLNKNIRGVSARLFLLSIISIILYYAGLIIK